MEASHPANGRKRPDTLPGLKVGPQRTDAIRRRPATQPEVAVPSAETATVVPDIAAPAYSLRKYKVILGVAVGLALLFCAGLVLMAAALLGRSKPADKESASVLENLKTLQRTWWDTEGLAAGAGKDLDGALSRLQDKQRGWWENEGLVKNGDQSGDVSLARLEEIQRNWFEKEGLANGGPCADPAGALARLDEISRKWWAEEAPARPRPDADTAADSDNSTDTAPSGELADLKVKLLDKEGTRRFLETGGTRESEEAVQLGLQWLAAQQQTDGSWSTEGGKGRRGGSNVTMTAFAVLPFLARGETHKGSQAINLYTKQVERAVQYLIAQQKPDGDLRGGSNMYTHALATMAVCEALGMTADPMLRGPCQRAIDFLIKAQARDGGWRYTPHPAIGDLSVTSWCLMALKSGQMAGIIIPRETLDHATKFLKNVSRADGGYGYTKGNPGHSPPQPAVMTAAGIACRHYLVNQSGASEEARSTDKTRGIDLIVNHPPKSNIKNFYYWYYATYALLPVGGDAWKQWNPQVRDLLVGLQNKGDGNAALKGSWDPNGAYQLTASGRVGVTALALLTLEVYYRHLPLNRPELGEMAKDLSKTTK